MTMFALLLANRGVNILANYTIKHEKAEKIDYYGLLDLLRKGRQIQPYCVALDEIQGWLDSRVSQSKTNRYGTYFLFQSAKLGYDLIYTAQSNMRADVDFRYLTDLRLLAQKDEENNRFIYKVLDPRFPDRNVPTSKGLIITFEQASNWWHLYNTFEAVQPVGLEEMFIDMEKNDPERLDLRIQQYAEQVKKYLGVGPVTTYSVKNALLRLKLPVASSTLVYGRVQELRYRREPQEKRSLSQWNTKIPLRPKK